MRYIINRWRGKAGYKEILVLALPLIISTASWSIQHFVDRMFLAWYSPEAIAAALPAGMLNFTILSLFIGTAGYVSTFASQYYGAERYDRIGPSVWQGIYIAAGASLVFIMLYPFAGAVFGLVGHEEAVMREETVYFRMLCFGAGPAVASAALAGFFSGIGKTSIVMYVNIAATAFNIVLDYILIFGAGFIPSLGIAGAGIATSLSAVFAMLLYFGILFTSGYSKSFNTIKGWRFDREIFARLIRYGLPSGIQFFIEITGFTLFLLFMGRLGITGLASTNIAFNISTLAFMPMIGLGIAVSILVGQNLGSNRPDNAAYCVYSGLHIALFYMGTVAIMFFFVPGIFILPFTLGSGGAEFAEIKITVAVLLKFIAVYNLFDAFNIIFANALRGAGDTRYVMFAMTTITAVVFVVPVYIVLFVLEMGIYGGWTIAAIYVMALGIAFFVRFLRGKWKKMRVIEDTVIVIPPKMPEGQVSGY